MKSVHGFHLTAGIFTLQSTRDALQMSRSVASEREDELTGLILDLESLQGVNDEKDVMIAELTEQASSRKEENEFLKLPQPEKVKGEIVGYVGMDECVTKARELIQRAGFSAWTRGPWPLASIETLSEFLDSDSTNEYPSCWSDEFDYGDRYAFELKRAWDASGLPQLSLGVLKMEVDDPRYGQLLTWRNVFLTEEQGRLVFYEVNPCNDSVTRIDEPADEYKIALLLAGGRFK